MLDQEIKDKIKHIRDNTGGLCNFTYEYSCYSQGGDDESYLITITLLKIVYIAKIQSHKISLILEDIINNISSNIKIHNTLEKHGFTT